MKTLGKLGAFIIAVAFTIMISMDSVKALSESDIDFDRKGGIDISVRYEKEPVAGGTLTIYKIADYRSNKGALYFEATKDFKTFGNMDYENADSEMTGVLADYTDNMNIAGETFAVDMNGKVSFGNLSLGLYLVVQNEAAKGFEKILPFFVSVPDSVNGEIRYFVDASPKTETISKTKKGTLDDDGGTNHPFPDDDPGSDPKSDPVTDDKIPQTGFLLWPVIVMLTVGLLMISIGAYLITGNEAGKINKMNERPGL